MSETSETTEATSLSTVATAAIKEAAPVWSSTDTDLMLTSLDEIGDPATARNRRDRALSQSR